MIQNYTIEQIDGATAAKLHRELNTSLPNYYEGVLSPEALEGCVQETKRNTNFSVKINGQHVASLSYLNEFPLHFWLHYIAVKPEYHRQGLGSALLSKLFEKATKQNAKTIILKTLSPKAQNQHYLKTYAFYEKNGFEPMFERPAPNNQNTIFIIKLL